MYTKISSVGEKFFNTKFRINIYRYLEFLFSVYCINASRNVEDVVTATTKIPNIFFLNPIGEGLGEFKNILVINYEKESITENTKR
jgi:hypothetical protein